MDVRAEDGERKGFYPGHKKKTLIRSLKMADRRTEKEGAMTIIPKKTQLMKTLLFGWWGPRGLLLVQLLTPITHTREGTHH